MIRLSELRYKEVINECTCRRLGCIEDLEFDEKCGQICAVIIPGQCKCFGLFGKEEEFVSAASARLVQTLSWWKWTRKQLPGNNQLDKAEKYDKIAERPV